MAIAVNGLSLVSDSGASGSDRVTNNGRIKIDLTGGDTVWQYSLNGGKNWLTGGSASADADAFFTATGDGAKNIWFRTLNGTTETGRQSISFTLDTRAPTAPAVTLAQDTGVATDRITSNGDLTINAGTGNSWEYSLNGTNWISGSATTLAESTILAGLPGDGLKTVYVRAKDAAGNVSSATTFSFTLDNTAPDAPTISALTNGFSVTAGAEVEVRVGGTSAAVLDKFTKNTSGGVDTYTAKAGAFTGAEDVDISATRRDAAGNASAASVLNNQTFDTTGPAATIASASYDAVTNTLVLTGTKFNELGATDVKAQLDWAKLVWDIDGDVGTGNYTFSSAHVSSAKVTDDTTLTIVLNEAGAAALENTTGYAGKVEDRIDVTAGFLKDAVGNASTTDATPGATTSPPAPGGAPLTIKTLYVGVGPGQYDTIQQAVNAAQAGDTIIVAAGSYAEIVTIETDITLTGAGSATKINGQITIKASGVSIEDLEVNATGLNHGIQLSGGANNQSPVTRQGVSLTDVKVSGANYGVELKNFLTVEDMSLTNVTLTGNQTGLRGSKETNIDGLTITGGLIADNAVFGILTAGGEASGVTIDKVVIQGTTFTNNGANWPVNPAAPIENDPNNGDLALFSYTGTVLRLEDLTFTTETRSAIFVGGAGQPVDDFVFDGIAVTTDTDGAFRAVKLSGLVGGLTQSVAQLLDGVAVTGSTAVFAELSGSAAADTVVGTDAADLINPSTGNDVLQGGGGNDYLQGGDGTDTALYTTTLTASMFTAVPDAYPYRSGVGYDLGWQVATGAAEGTDLLTGTEIVDGAGPGVIHLVGNGGYSTIQAAIDAATAGDTIVVAAGSYGPVNISKSVTLAAAAGATPVITGAGVNQGAAIRVDPNISDVSITGFSVAAGAGDLAAVNLVGNNDRISLSNNTISGNAGHAVLGGGGTDGVTLTNNTISGNGPPPVVYFNGSASLGATNASTAVSLIGNTITGGAGAGLLLGLESSGGAVTNNTFTGSASYAQVEVWAPGTTFAGNSFGASGPALLVQGSSANNSITTRGGISEVVYGKEGTDTATYGSLAGATIAAVADADPVASGDQPGWQVAFGSVVDRLNSIEIIDDADPGVIRLVGSGGYADIAAAYAAAASGDTLLLAGSSAGLLVADKSVAIRGGAITSSINNTGGATSTLTIEGAAFSASGNDAKLAAVYANSSVDPDKTVVVTNSSFAGFVAGVGGTEQTTLTVTGNSFTLAGGMAEAVGLGGGVTATITGNSFGAAVETGDVAIRFYSTSSPTHTATISGSSFATKAGAIEFTTAYGGPYAQSSATAIKIDLAQFATGSGVLADDVFTFTTGATYTPRTTLGSVSAALGDADGDLFSDDLILGITDTGDGGMGTIQMSLLNATLYSQAELQDLFNATFTTNDSNWFA
jgi:hypothetical protein